MRSSSSQFLKLRPVKAVGLLLISCRGISVVKQEYEEVKRDNTHYMEYMSLQKDAIERVMERDDE